MRICHVIESASGGSAAILALLALHSVRRGHEVHVVYSPGRADEDLVEMLRAGGCASVRPTQMRRSVGVHDVLDGMRVRRVLRLLGHLDVIHSHSSKAGALARIACRFQRTAQIYSPHGFFTMTGEAPFYVRQVERALSLVTDRIIAVSKFERLHALELGIGDRRLSVVPNGVPPFNTLSREQARHELGLDKSAFVVGFVGRLESQKDPIAAIDSFAQVQARVQVQYVVVGDGELKAAAQSRASKLGSMVKFAGARDAKPLFSALDCLVCTSRYEGMPVSFLEALHCGLPIITYPVGGSDELVVDGRTGFITRPDPGSAARAIEMIAGMEPAARRRMSDACRNLGSVNTDQTMGDATLNLYRDVLAKRRQAR